MHRTVAGGLAYSKYHSSMMPLLHFYYLKNEFYFRKLPLKIVYFPLIFYGEFSLNSRLWEILAVFSYFFTNKVIIVLIYLVDLPL